MEEVPEMKEPPQERSEPMPSESAGELPLLEEAFEVLEPEEGLPALPEAVELESPGGDCYRVKRWIKRLDGRNLYEGEKIEAGSSQPIWIWEEVAPATSLEKEAAILRELSSHYFLGAITFLEREGRAYLVTEAGPQQTLEELFQGGLPFVRFVSILTQTAAGLDQLHRAGWVHTGVRPSQILVGSRVKLIGVNGAVRIGEPASSPLHYPGYSAPDLADNEPLHPWVDIYGLGAILYHAASGEPAPDAGPEMLTWVPRHPLSGVPPILHRCLGPQENRYRDIAALRGDLAALLRRSRPIPTFEVAGASIIGLNPTRPCNEDAYGYLTGQSVGEEGLVSWGVFCLADGMGGMDAGEVASQTAVKVVLRRAIERLRSGAMTKEAEHAEWPVEWVQAANEAVCEELARCRVRGGTTLLAVALLNHTITIGHVGDCRLYLVRGQEARLLTRDHSLAMLNVLQGEIAPEALRHHPDRNRLIRALGERTPLPLYYIDSLATTTDRARLMLEEGDLLILCSDGVWEPVEEAELISAVTGGQPPASAVKQILSLVLERGAPDNATIILVRLSALDVVGSRAVTASR